MKKLAMVVFLIYSTAAYADLPATGRVMTSMVYIVSDQCEAEEGERVVVAIFPVLGETTTSIEPADGAFDDPA